MSVKAGKILSIGNGLLVERLQSVGPGQLNIPTEKIQETGNELTVETIRDVPDLSFDAESLDTSTDFEAMLTGVDPSTTVDGDVFSLDAAKPIDVVSPFKGQGVSKTSVRAVVIPYLVLESASYKFGVRANATQTFSLKGDAIYYIPGNGYYETFAGGTIGPFSYAHTALRTVEKGTDIFALCVTIVRSDGTYQRLFHGEDYTDTNAAATLTVASPAGSTVHIVYGSATQATYAQTIHTTPSVKPGAVRGKDIDLYVATGPSRSTVVATTSGDATLVGTGFEAGDVGDSVVGTGIPTGTTIITFTDATHVEMSANATATAASVTITQSPALHRWAGVQSVEINRRVNLEVEDELGNPHHTGADYDYPELSGTITMRPSTVEYLFARIAEITNTSTADIANVLSSTPLEMQIRISHPQTGARLKTFRVTDARIDPPGTEGRVQQKLEPQMNWSSDSGALQIIKGAPL